jgi:hypothetical protein
MPEQVHHYGKFEINYGRNPHEILADGEGWFLYTDIVDALRTKQASMTQDRYVADRWTRSVKKRWKHAKKLAIWKDFVISDIPGLKGVFLRPYVVHLDEATCRSEFDFSITGDFGVPVDQEDEYDFVASSDAKFTEMIHGEGISHKEEWTYEDLKSSQITWSPPKNLCPNLFFAVGIRRQGIDEDGTEGIEAVADLEVTDPCQWFWTRIFFGGTPRLGDGSGGFRWCLVIPLTGEPYLEEGFYADTADDDGLWLKRPFTQGSLSQVEPRSMATQGKTYYIGVLNDHIVISENGFESGFAAYRANNSSQPLIPEGAVRIYHWPGQCAMWLAPLAFRDWGEGYLSGIQGWTYQDNIRLERIRMTPPDQTYHIYGYSIAGYYSPSGLVWPGVPDWWPGLAEWPDDNFWGTENYGTFIKAPLWPPYGPVGEWPAWAPPGWPEGEAWPPVDGWGVLRKCPKGVPGGGGSMSGGDMDFLPPHQSDADDQCLIWQVNITPSIWDPGGGHQKTYSTPFVEAVAIWQEPFFQPEDVGVAAQPSAAYSVTMAEAELEENTSCNAEVVVENAAATYGFWPSTLLRPGSTCRVTVGAQYAADGSQILPDGVDEYVAYGGLILVEAQPDPIHAGLHLTDPLGMLQLAKWDRGDLNFRLWNPRNALVTIASMYGIPGIMWADGDPYNLEDLGEVLRGDWSWSLGTGIFQIMSDIATRGQRNAALWFDPVLGKIQLGCRYCGAKRLPYDPDVDEVAANHDWIHHQDNGWNSSGCLHEDLHRTSTDDEEDPWDRDYRKGNGIDWPLYVDQDENRAALEFIENFAAKSGKLSSADYANRVMAEGKTFDGYPIRLWKADLKSIGSDGVNPVDMDRYIGWRITKVESVQGEGTYNLLDQKLSEMDAAFGNRRIETPPITLPLMPPLRVRNVVKIYGGDWVPNANEAKFRVTSVSHSAKDHRTTIKLRQMIGEAD